MLVDVVKSTARALLVSTIVYFGFLGLLTIPALQDQVIYLNRVTLTWFQDVNYPEQWGFLHNQVTPFTLATRDGETLHAWHVLPLEAYRQHQDSLCAEPDGLAADMRQRQSFRLLRDDPDSLLVLYLHGAAGTLGSGYRPPSYRAMSALAPARIHVVAIDYRGFGRSSGAPSEAGLVADAEAMARWARDEAGIPPQRTVVFAQSLGTGVATALAHRLAVDKRPALFRGVVLVAPFVNVAELTASYRVAGVVPLLSPLVRLPWLHAFFNRFIWTSWLTRDRLAAYVDAYEQGGLPAEARYHVTLLHAEDDYDIPSTHSESLFAHALNVSSYGEVKPDDVAVRRGAEGGWAAEHKTERGLLRLEMLKHGLHDRIMGYPAVSLAVWRAFLGV